MARLGKQGGEGWEESERKGRSRGKNVIVAVVRSGRLEIPREKREEGYGPRTA
jgi:hypothetical protein